MIQEWVIEILRCPETGLKFKLKSNVLIRADGKILKPNENILSLVYPNSLSGKDAKMNRLYEKIAPFYDLSERIFGWLLTKVNIQRGREDIISKLYLRPGQRLLEVSPGPGVFQPMLRRILGNNAEIASLDLSLNMLRQCYKRYKKCNSPGGIA